MYKKMRPRRKVCQFCKGKDQKPIDYKDIELLSKYITFTAKIAPRTQTGTCAKIKEKLLKLLKMHVSWLYYHSLKTNYCI